jgi:nitroimidazol reductase NimA-like FMN-containing flavoprotein (pyridoxamine 5'-phosphate oxidase superfamily)
MGVDDMADDQITLTDKNGMLTLSRDACLRYLGRTGVGRVAVTVGALPAIFPVNYAMKGDDVVFRTAQGTKLDAAVRNAVVAFEVDHSDRMSHTGWSVMILGPARAITDPGELADTDLLPLTRWARAGGAESTVCISTDLVSGRELVNLRYQT